MGIAAEALADLPARGATSKLRSFEQLESGVGTLGFRGEALATLSEVAVLEITSRAAGSFETFTKVACTGRAAKFGLALEQTGAARQGTVVHVRDFWYNNPVRRKALLAAG